MFNRNKVINQSNARGRASLQAGYVIVMWILCGYCDFASSWAARPHQSALRRVATSVRYYILYHFEEEEEKIVRQLPESGSDG